MHTEVFVKPGNAMNESTAMSLETAPEALLRLLAAAMERVQRHRVRPKKPGRLHRV